MKKIFIKHHLGLGDCIAHNGMVRKVLFDNPDSEVYLSSKSHNYDNMKFMYRDNQNVKILVLDDQGTNEHLRTNHYDQVISSHFEGKSNSDYLNIGDDAFYHKAGFDPKVRKDYFYLERDYVSEKKLYDKITSEIGSQNYILIHEKPEDNIIIDRKKIPNNLPIVYAKKEYNFFDLLTVMEKAQEIHLVSSSFLVLFMIKRFNEKVFAHMYADRSNLTTMIKYHGIDVIS